MTSRAIDPVVRSERCATSAGEADPPGRDDILAMVSKHMYSETILNNAHRGDVVEMMVLAALGSNWRFVGLGWHPWDLQRGDGEDRVRIQVKHSAALQLWGRTRNPIVSFGWKEKAPSFFFRDNPGESIEAEGWFCDVFVVGIHQVDDEETIDQVDPRQWSFLVIPTCDLEHGTSSMALSRALARWKPVCWQELHAAVERAVETMQRDRATWRPRQDSNLRRTV